jgi:hypothetical protein
MRLAREPPTNESAHAQVRAVASAKLEQLRTWLTAEAPVDGNLQAHYRYQAQQIAMFQKDPKSVNLTALRPLDPPPGQPIGMECSMPE